MIGENNSGKSSILQSLSLFFTGSSLASSHYYDSSKEIRLELTFSDIAGPDLERLAEEHRQRIVGIVEEGQLTLVRIYGTDGRSKLRYVAMVPRDPRFSTERVDELVSRQRPGAGFRNRVLDVFPDLSAQITSASTQAEVRAAIGELGQSLPAEQKELSDTDLPTGIEASVKALQPEVIYVPAVKDLTDDIKTKEGTPFGRLLGILLRAIEPKLADMKDLFEKLDGQLNRVVLADGSIRDERLGEVRQIEQAVDRYVKESFSSVDLKIRIPPPELKTILSSAQILANDGVEGPLETKGDGLRRAVVFAILRTYVDLTRSGLATDAPGPTPTNSYLLLFEEPELYLHPKGQQILFDALSVFSKHHHVLVTTHSPLFFGPDATATFTKLTKRTDEGVGPVPFTCTHPVDLTEMSAKDQFQIICHENNSIAFFADTVVLVEGDTDYIVLPHLARTIDPRWDAAKASVRFARINGKTSIRRYKAFFNRFNTRVTVISDLDLVIDGFGQIDPTPELIQSRQGLLAAIDATIKASGTSASPSTEQIKEAHTSQDIKSKWERARAVHDSFRNGKVSFEEVRGAVDEFFVWQRSEDRLAELRSPKSDEVLKLKRQLLTELRSHDVYVLDRGDVESYYPPAVTGPDKPSRAMALCGLIRSRDEALALCPQIIIDGASTEKPELEIIFGLIFRA